MPDLPDLLPSTDIVSDPAAEVLSVRPARSARSLLSLHPDLHQASRLSGPTSAQPSPHTGRSGQASTQGASISGSLRPSIPSGHSALDAQLPGGGWPVGCVTELLARSPGLGELRLLAPALRRLSQGGRRILMLAPPQLPYGPALAALGIAPEQFIIIRAAKAADRLWAVEQSLKSGGVGALLAWLEEPTRPEAMRRFQLTARCSSGPVFVFRPLSVQDQPSPAPLRLALLPRGYPSLAVQILKRRGPVYEAPLLLQLPLPSRAMRPLEDSIQLPAHHALDRLSVSQPGLRQPAPAHPARIRTAPSH